MARDVVTEFVEAINRKDTVKITNLMHTDHFFIDAHGNQLNRDQMVQGWPMYFEMFPDYKIEVEHRFEKANVVMLSGWASAGFKGDSKSKWRLPAAWRAEIKHDKILLWQVFADTKIPFESMKVS